MTTRKLLDMAATAAKLGMCRQTFSKRRRDLERKGFPAPALERDAFGGARWDEKAIDLWLDARIPPHLRREPVHPDHAVDVVAIEQTLQNRARSLVL